MGTTVVTPYNQTDRSKKEQVADMFNNIANKYDLLNSLLSFGIHHKWRKKAVKLLADKHPKKILDIATGTGDFAIETLALNPEEVIGLDISAGMLEMGKEKLKERKLEHKIQLKLGDAENIPFEENHFDAITVAFGVRNFENLEAGLCNMLRVLKPGGTIAIIEFSMPKGFFKWIYLFYFKFITPTIGRLFSKDYRAYSYLPESVQAFPYGESFLSIMQQCGFKNCKAKSLTFGVASIYTGIK